MECLAIPPSNIFEAIETPEWFWGKNMRMIPNIRKCNIVLNFNFSIRRRL